MAADPALDVLTDEQLVAAATDMPCVFLESAPGSGKTTVAAQRFGALRYRPRVLPDGRRDHRAVVAVSFTRSATWELHQRVRRSWGPTALTWPHRICTLDTLVYDLLQDLLLCGLVRWPGGHTALEVHDSWKVLVRYANMNLEWTVSVRSTGDAFVGNRRHESRAMRPEPAPLKEAVSAGRCTHEDVRWVLAHSLRRPEVQTRVTNRLSQTIRALIVDEVYDANALDLALIRAVADTGADVTIIGDPWQALYGFRGAKPDKVPTLIANTGMTTLPLSRSFRWRSEEQRALAEDLRAGHGLTLPQAGADAGFDVVLAGLWEALWTAGDMVLPLAWGSARGNLVEAATTLLLNQVTRDLLGVEATFLPDALATLGITDRTAVDRLETPFADLLGLLSGPTSKKHFDEVYYSLIAAIGRESGRDFPPKSHANYTSRLQRLAQRLSADGVCTPGMTVHQAKGREWDRVGVRITDSERVILAVGLHPADEAHRPLYVACTRARYWTADVLAASG